MNSALNGWYTLLLRKYQRITTAKIPLCLLRNKKEKVKTTYDDCCSLTNIDISYKYTLTVRNKLDTLQETSEMNAMKTLLVQQHGSSSRVHSNQSKSQM